MVIFISELYRFIAITMFLNYGFAVIKQYGNNYSEEFIEEPSIYIPNVCVLKQSANWKASKCLVNQKSIQICF